MTYFNDKRRGGGFKSREKHILFFPLFNQLENLGWERTSENEKASYLVLLELGKLIAKTRGGGA